MLSPGSITTITEALFEHELEGSPAAQILGAAAAALMLTKSPVDVNGDAGIQTAICTANNVQAITPVRHERRGS